MSLFSAIGSLYKEPESDSVGDDNSAVSATENNPFVEASVLGARNAYGTMHSLVSPIIKGKEASLRQIDRQLKEWEGRLQKIVDMYTELLKKLNDLGADFTSTMTLDFAKEAWEIVQDTPILRRYMGEANYWYLHDTVGLLATQSGSIAADMAAGIKEYLRAAILALISMTDGLLCLESYLGMIQQWWGGLYMKVIPLPVLDSIVPNVTTAYWYKPTIPSRAMDGATVLQNNPPGKGFTPIPIPIPDPVMLTRDMGYVEKFNWLEPSTWYLNGSPYYLPNTMTMLYRALNYWTSSYTDAVLPAVNDIYPRTDYANGEHPLVVGKTFAQLDTDKMSLDGTDMSGDGQDASFASVIERLRSVITEDMADDIRSWEENYVLARREFIVAVDRIATEYGISVNSVAEMYAATDADSNNVYWGRMVEIADSVRRYVTEMDNAVSRMADKAEMSRDEFFDAVISAFMDAGHMTIGATGALKSTQAYAVAPSYVPDRLTGVSDAMQRNIGIPFLAYAVDTAKNYIAETSSQGNAVEEGDVATVIWDGAEFSFVMFPSRVTAENAYASIMPAYMGDAVSASVTGIPAGTEVGSAGITDGDVLSYVFPFGMRESSQENLGSLPDALSRHSACSAVSVATGTLGNMLFPDGTIPSIADEESTRPTTFASLYESMTDTGTTTSEELADVIGYSIDRGREIKFPCFGVYGNLLSMQSWHYREMPTTEFNGMYAKVRTGYSLYYAVGDPSRVVYRHSSYYSATRQTDMTVYHEALESESKSYGERDRYDFYIYPGESVSVSRIPEGISLGSILSVDAVGPDGTEWHYIPMRNAIPKCAKYVDATKWSIMDLVHEMYLLAYNLADLTADNGATLRQLQEDLSAFNISKPEFVGQLPDDNGKYVTFRFGIFQDYADRIERLVNSVYEFREKIIAVTKAW